MERQAVPEQRGITVRPNWNTKQFVYAAIFSIVVAILVTGVTKMFRDEPAPQTIGESVTPVVPPINTADVDPDQQTLAVAIAEPAPPTWVREQPDGSFVCHRTGLVLGDREVRGADWMGHYRMTQWLHQEPVTAVDFVDDGYYVEGLIVGADEFASMPSLMRKVPESTLLIQRQEFPQFAERITVCLALPAQE